ncbi:HD domain-containing protein [Campylobacter canadensis]|uniref:HD domain-containing protein n=1 Tax=Campylobacter canadensis TaxID=449520 RepID=UPI001CCD2B24|nr:HD domain-containing protein [Campylobacter canadensis]MBZ8002759.1 HD domain-containing protein [Campylobacter canadensis]
MPKNIIFYVLIDEKNQCYYIDNNNSISLHENQMLKYFCYNEKINTNLFFKNIFFNKSQEISFFSADDILINNKNFKVYFNRFFNQKITLNELEGFLNKNSELKNTFFLYEKNMPFANSNIEKLFLHIKKHDICSLEDIETVLKTKQVKSLFRISDNFDIALDPNTDKADIKNTIKNYILKEDIKNQMLHYTLFEQKEKNKIIKKNLKINQNIDLLYTFVRDNIFLNNKIYKKYNIDDLKLPKEKKYQIAYKKIIADEIILDNLHKAKTIHQNDSTLTFFKDGIKKMQLEQNNDEINIIKKEGKYFLQDNNILEEITLKKLQTKQYDNLISFKYSDCAVYILKNKANKANLEIHLDNNNNIIDVKKFINLDKHILSMIKNTDILSNDNLLFFNSSNPDNEIFIQLYEKSIEKKVEKDVFSFSLGQLTKNYCHNNLTNEEYIMQIALQLLHCNSFSAFVDYSTLQHSLNVYKIAKIILEKDDYKQLNKEEKSNILIQALLHDAVEVIATADLPTPIKKHFPNYIDLEEEISTKVYQKLNLKLTNESSIVKYCDKLERNTFMFLWLENDNFFNKLIKELYKNYTLSDLDKQKIKQDYKNHILAINKNYTSEFSKAFIEKFGYQEKRILTKSEYLYSGVNMNIAENKEKIFLEFLQEININLSDINIDLNLALEKLKNYKELKQANIDMLTDSVTNNNLNINIRERSKNGLFQSNRKTNRIF